MQATGAMCDTLSIDLASARMREARRAGRNRAVAA
jgi:hypothetical protein